MLIQLDESLLGSLGELSQPEWDGVINLAVAAREGHHYLIASRALAAALSHKTEMGPRERALYKALSDRHSTIAGMASQVRMRARVTRDLVAERVTVSGITEIRIPLSFFSSTVATQPAILLCENLDDCNLIHEMARLFARAENMGAIRTNLDMRSGGGSTTADVADGILANGRRLLLTVVDSDRETPDGALGDTAKSARSVFRERNLATGEILILDGRDLENLLPDEFYRSEFENDLDHSVSVAFITALDGAGCSGARLHIDVKKGLTLDKLLMRKNPPQDFQAVWGVVAVRVSQGGLPCSAACVACASAASCLNPLACACILTQPNGGALLSRGVQAFRQHGREMWRTLPGCLKSAVNDVARSAFDWGCATAFQPS